MSIVREILQDLKEGDWFENRHGVLFEWRIERHQGIYRWYQIDVNYVGPPAHHQEKSLPFKDIELYGLGNEVVYKASVVGGPYVIFE